MVFVSIRIVLEAAAPMVTAGPVLHAHYTKAMSYKGFDNAFVVAVVYYTDYKDVQHIDYTQLTLETLAILDYSSYLQQRRGNKVNFTLAITNLLSSDEL